MEFLNVTSTGWAAIMVALSMSILAGMMFILGKQRMHYVWGFFSVAVVVWAGAFYAVTTTQNPETARLWWKISFAGLIMNPFLFFHFVLEFIDNDKINRVKSRILIPLYAVAALFLILNLSTNLIIDKVTFLFGEIYYNTPPGVLHPYFMIIFVGLVFLAHYLVFKEYRKRRDDILFRERTIYFFVATLIAYFGGTMNFLPVYGIAVPPVTSFAVAIGSGLIAYAILQYRLFNTRVVTAQFLTFILVSFSAIRLIVSDSTQLYVFNSLLLAVTIFVGYKLIGSVRREVEQREQLQILDKELESANEQLKQLDKARAEFISIASHQLRTPPATIKWYLAAITGGDFGPVNERVKKAVVTAETTNNSLISLIDDLLNASRIERGKMEFVYEPTDMLKITQITVDQLTPLALQRKQKIVYHPPKVEIPLVNADREKLRQVINNLIDNAIKYTPVDGIITVELSKTAKDVMVRVKDTGRGIKPTELENIFKKYDRGGKKMDSQGLGLGLYVARVVMQQHQGKIWAESEGEGKGSTFVISLPLNIDLKNSTLDLVKEQK